MCVIMIVEKNRPNEEMIEAAFRANPDGAGIAWREPAESGEKNVKEVVWKKGLDLEEVKELCAIAPSPYVVHFRVASIGGVRPQLTHPFEISNNASIALDGRTQNNVLFHNGHWNDWASYSRDAAIRTKTPIPAGRWNDSRAMAWLCSIYGVGLMEFLTEQRGVAFGPYGMDIFTGPGWVQVDMGTGKIWCSNDYFQTRSRFYSVSSMCRFGRCTRKDTDTTGYCLEHTRIGTKSPLALSTSPVHVENGTSPAGTGGAQQTNPFLPIPKGQIVGLAKAELMFRDNKISKKQLKAIRKYYLQLDGDARKAEKARRSLECMTQMLNSGNGPAH